LKAVATEENLTAAELLYVSQPSLSKQIKTLESGYPLINRENNKISLTENGKVFLHCERILALCEESCRIN
jgi:DNA-binding transcriptional LysR family regulator